MTEQQKPTISVSVINPETLDDVLRWAAVCEEAVGMPLGNTIIGIDSINKKITATAFVHLINPAS